MNFFEAIKSVFSKYFQLSGRSGRAEFWYFMLFQGIVCFLLGFVDELGIAIGIFSLAIFIPNITVSVRRLHDIDRSGWWMGWLGWVSWVMLLCWPWLIAMAMSNQEMPAIIGTIPLSYVIIGSILIIIDMLPLSYIIIGSVLGTIGMSLFFYWMCSKGTTGENRFGPDPLTSDRN